MKKSHFLGDWWFLCDLLCHFWWIFGWDWGTPAILRQYPNIYGHFQGKLGFGQFWKKVGIGSDPPPPSLGQNPNFYQKLVLEASLTVLIKWIKICFRFLSFFNNHTPHSNRLTIEYNHCNRKLHRFSALQVYIVYGYGWSSMVADGCRWLSLVIVGCQWFSLVVDVCLNVCLLSVLMSDLMCV